MKCPFCAAKHFLGESPVNTSFSNCWQKGKVDLTSLTSKPFPVLFKNLLTGKHSQSKNLMTHVRSFNSAFSFASLGA